MNNLNIFESTFAAFRPINWTPRKNKPANNCSGNCPAKIKGLPFWINNKPFWTYQCKCCQTYQFEAGKNQVLSETKVGGHEEQL